MIIHAVRCDYEGCSKEEPLVVIQERHMNGATSFEKPKHWLQYDRKDFHAHGCVAAYAAQKQREMDVAP